MCVPGHHNSVQSVFKQVYARSVFIGLLSLERAFCFHPQSTFISFTFIPCCWTDSSPLFNPISWYITLTYRDPIKDPNAKSFSVVPPAIETHSDQLKRKVLREDKTRIFNYSFLFIQTVLSDIGLISMNQLSYFPLTCFFYQAREVNTHLITFFRANYPFMVLSNPR